MFYKTNNSTVVNAILNMNAAKEQFIIDAKKWAGKYGGTPVYNNETTGLSAVFIQFDDFYSREDKALWILPKASNRYGVRPRGQCKKASDRDAHEKLKREFYADKPKKVCRKSLLESIGLDWSSFIFGGGLDLFVEDGFAYLKTNLDISKACDGVIEILGSEFENAKIANGK